MTLMLFAGLVHAHPTDTSSEEPIGCVPMFGKKIIAIVRVVCADIERDAGQQLANSDGRAWR
jgi:hypothetical protein